LCRERSRDGSPTLPDAVSIEPEHELDLLLARDPVWESHRHRVAAIGSVSVHILLILVALNVKESPYVRRTPQRAFVPTVIPLYIPRELTQRAPNKAPVSKELSVESIAPRPSVKAPAPAPAAAKPQMAKVAPPIPAPPTPRDAPKQVVIEPPKIEAPVQGVQEAQLPKSSVPLPSPEKPKVALENVIAGNSPAGAANGRGTGLIQVPSASVQDAVRSLSRSQGTPGSMTVGDVGAEEGGWARVSTFPLPQDDPGRSSN